MSRAIRTLEDLVQETGDPIHLKTVMGWSTVEREMRIEELFTDSANSYQDDLVMRYFHWIIQAMVDSGDNGDDQVRMAIHLLKRLPQHKPNPVQGMSDPCLLEAKKQILKFIVDGWVKTKEEEEADEFLRFFLSWGNLPEERKLKQEVLREGTAQSSKLGRLARGYFMAKEFSKSGGEDLAVILAIARARSFDARSILPLELKVTQPLLGMPSEVYALAETLAVRVASFAKSEALKSLRALFASPKEDQFGTPPAGVRGDISFEDIGHVVVTFYATSSFALFPEEDLPYDTKAHLFQIWGKVANRVEKWAQAHRSERVTLRMMLKYELRQVKPRLFHEKTYN